VNACTNANPERDENASEADQAKGKAARFQAHVPQCCHEGVDGEKLMRRAISLSLKIGEETHKGDQGDTKFTNLLDDALRCAIVPRRHDTVVSPLDIEDAAHSLQKIEHEKGELSSKKSMSRGKRAAGEL
jgi:hypothetical protein